MPETFQPASFTIVWTSSATRFAETPATMNDR